MTSLSTSTNLLRRLEKKESAAWDRFCALYCPIIYGWCRRSQLQASDAGDVTQEVLRAVFENLDRFRGRHQGGGSFRAWLWTITMNQIRLLHRKSANQPRAAGGSDAHQHLANVPDPHLPEADPEAEDTRLRVLRGALDIIRGDFAPATWTIFERTALANEPYRTVALEMNSNENAVRQARYRVLCRLRQVFEGLL